MKEFLCMSNRQTIYDDFSREELIDLLLKRDKEIDSLKKKYHVMSTDELTGTLNRQAGFEALNRKLRKSDTVICLLDMNNLKKINDTEGHIAGDNAIRIMVETVKHYIPKNTLIIRIGGDEFLIVFENIDINKARALMTKVKKILLNKSKGMRFPITFSFGLLDASKYSDLTIKEIIDKVDKTMYRQKKNSKLGREKIASMVTLLGD
jgi:diguanylate cyclase (GGDEF)-like protein